MLEHLQPIGARPNYQMIVFDRIDAERTLCDSAVQKNPETETLSASE
jgi:hypothetical protein